MMAVCTATAIVLQQFLNYRMANVWVGGNVRATRNATNMFLQQERNNIVLNFLRLPLRLRA